ncbi:MAG: methyltransferase domain-containing protein [Algoriphagus sp.]|uniref:class I SAM-dependent methyltransferase n=1 Tax=Algoriphagus sp. TaxID=1872435 RepID=UPI00272F5B17|nr:class I SAM-dependent methyltransferase [Algoriphagus sp.]MDP2042484.1 methyltransferase domain-containing protein [Algoriphagus sp.]MDP3473838.1 methyltransferase domain-containing protein [Algoriphagus sp.]
MNNKQKFTPALGFNSLSGFYDIAIKLSMPELKIRQSLIQELNPSEGEYILEFGFGTGSNLIMLSQINPYTKYFGLDIDPKMKDIAEKRFQKHSTSASLELYDGGRFPFEDESFDKVFSCLVFHQLDRTSKQLCLKELYRVIKQKGMLIIADFGKASSQLMRVCFLTIQLLDGWKSTRENVKGLLPQFITEAGFINVIEKESMNTSVGTFSYYEATK